MYVENYLIEQGFHQAPLVYLKSNLSQKDKNDTMSYVVLLGGQVTSIEENATHIIHPRIDIKTDLYCRPVLQRGDKCMIHFLQLPDSDNGWGTFYLDAQTRSHTRAGNQSLKRSACQGAQDALVDLHFKLTIDTTE